MTKIRNKRTKKAQRTTLKAIRVALIVDDYGSVALDRTGDDERAEYRDLLQRGLTPHALTFEEPRYVSDNLRADLVVFDFGGMSLGNDLLADNSRRLIRWAQDHPSSLVVIASSFTYARGLEPELEDLGLVNHATRRGMFSDDRSENTPIANVLALDGLSHGDERAIATIKEWFDAA